MATGFGPNAGVAVLQTNVGWTTYHSDVEPALLSAERSRAMEIASALAARSDVSGVAIFGSHARGTAVRDSDLDLLVLLSEGRATPATLAAELPEELHGDDISLSVFTSTTLRNYLEDWSRFAMHLQHESVVVYDQETKLRDIIDQRVDLSLSHEFGKQVQRFRQFEHLERFGERMTLPLAHLYRLGRTLVFVNLAQRGHLDFDRHTAFALLKHLDGDLAVDIDLIERLSPFYSQWRGLETGIRTPFDPNGSNAASQTVAAREAVRRLLAAAENRAGAQ